MQQVGTQLRQEQSARVSLSKEVARLQDVIEE